MPILQLLFVARDHRDDNNRLIQLKLKHLACNTTYHVYEPLQEYRKSCPWILIISRGVHTHPIPISQKTPPRLRSVLMMVLRSLDMDLADLTPRRFLRHPIVKAFLRSLLPDITQPTLSDLHISFANRSHLKHYIDQIKNELFPKGTGWEGTPFLCRYFHFESCLKLLSERYSSSQTMSRCRSTKV